MKRVLRKATALFFVLMILCSTASAWLIHAEDELENPPVSDGEPAPVSVMILESDALSVAIGKTVQMTAKVTNVETQPAITWKSSDTGIAEVDKNGLVKGKSVGKATIFAVANVNGQQLRGEFAINVTKRSDFIKDYLMNNQVLSYQYSYVDDFYYTNDREAWQRDFGFGKVYDIAAPFVLLEYDYIRIFFTYEGKDWMLQMWKGQYGMIFYGSEIGIYNRDHVDDGVNEWTFFNCPGESDWLNMEMTLYHKQLNGEYVREFTRNYDKYWWCTGFKNGHLRQVEPADELCVEARITLKDEEMTNIIAKGLVECGFRQKNSKDAVGLDSFCVDGNDIYIIWQNISEAESTMFIKVSTGFLSAIMLMPFWPVITPFVGLFAFGALLVSIIL